MNPTSIFALPLAGLLILAAITSAPADNGPALGWNDATMARQAALNTVPNAPPPAHPPITPEVRQEIAHLWDKDEIRKTPMDPQIIKTSIVNGAKVDEVYITSRITPQGPDKVFFTFTRPVQSDHKMPIYIDVSGGNDPGNIVLDGRRMNCAAVNIEWRNPNVEHHSIWAEHSDGPKRERSMWTMKPDIKNSITYAFEVAIVRVIDYLSQQPDIDASRIAIGGSSYGGWYSLFTAAIDPRITCVNAVFVAGGLDGQMSANGLTYRDVLQEDEKSTWTEAYDVLTYIPRIKSPTLMTEATNDFFFWVGDAIDNYKALKCEKRLLIIPNCNHGQIPFGVPTEGTEATWVHHAINGEPEFPTVTDPVARAATYSFNVKSIYPISKATLYWSPGESIWPGRYWLAVPATQNKRGWSATIPAQFAPLCGELFVTIADDHDRRVSSLIVRRDGIDPGTAAGPLWTGGAMWDVDRGAGAWRPVMGIDAPSDVKAVAPAGLKIIPKTAAAKFALITNSVILASGVASTHTGVRIVIDGGGEAGELNVALQRRAGSFHEEVTQGQISYVKSVQYGAGISTVDIPWTDFKGPGKAPALPYPFNGLRFIGQRASVTPLTIQSIEMY